MFQSLIGTIKTNTEQQEEQEEVTEFQSLIGTIKTMIGFSKLPFIT